MEKLKEALKGFTLQQRIFALGDGEFLSKFDVTMGEVEDLYWDILTITME